MAQVVKPQLQVDLLSVRLRLCHVIVLMLGRNLDRLFWHGRTVTVLFNLSNTFLPLDKTGNDAKSEKSTGAILFSL